MDISFRRRKPCQCTRCLNSCSPCPKRCGCGAYPSKCAILRDSEIVQRKQESAPCFCTYCLENCFGCQDHCYCGPYPLKCSGGLRNITIFVWVLSKKCCLNRRWERRQANTSSVDEAHKRQLPARTRCGDTASMTASVLQLKVIIQRQKRLLLSKCVVGCPIILAFLCYCPKCLREPRNDKAAEIWRNSIYTIYGTVTQTVIQEAEMQCLIAVSVMHL